MKREREEQSGPSERKSRPKRKVPELPAGGPDRTLELIRLARHLHRILDDLLSSLDDFVTSDPMPNLEFVDAVGKALELVGQAQVDRNQLQRDLLWALQKEQKSGARNGTALKQLAKKVGANQLMLFIGQGGPAKAKGQLSASEYEERVRAFCSLKSVADRFDGPLGITSPYANVVHDLDRIESVLEHHFETMNAREGSDSQALSVMLGKLACELVVKRRTQGKSRRARLAKAIEVISVAADHRNDGWPESIGETVPSVAEQIEEALSETRSELVQAQRAYALLWRESSASIPPQEAHEPPPKGPLRDLLTAFLSEDEPLESCKWPLASKKKLFGSGFRRLRDSK